MRNTLKRIDYKKPSNTKQVKSAHNIRIKALELQSCQMFENMYR